MEVAVLVVCFILIPFTCNSQRNGCGDILTGFTGTFSSPNYPNGYTNFLVCEWIVSVPSGQIGLEITEVDVESSTTCSYDKIVVRDGNSKGAVLGVFCEPKAVAIVASGRTVSVKFTSDYSVTGNGFAAQWRGFNVPVTTKLVVPQWFITITVISAVTIMTTGIGIAVFYTKKIWKGNCCCLREQFMDSSTFHQKQSERVHAAQEEEAIYNSIDEPNCVTTENCELSVMELHPLNPSNSSHSVQPNVEVRPEIIVHLHQISENPYNPYSYAFVPSPRRDVSPLPESEQIDNGYIDIETPSMNYTRNTIDKLKTKHENTGESLEVQTSREDAVGRLETRNSPEEEPIIPAKPGYIDADTLDIHYADENTGESLEVQTSQEDVGERTKTRNSPEEEPTIPAEPGYARVEEEPTIPAKPGYARVKQEHTISAKPGYARVDEEPTIPGKPVYARVDEEQTIPAKPGYARVGEEQTIPAKPGYARVEEVSTTPAKPGYVTAIEIISTLSDSEPTNIHDG